MSSQLGHNFMTLIFTPTDTSTHEHHNDTVLTQYELSPLDIIPVAQIIDSYIYKTVQATLQLLYT